MSAFNRAVTLSARPRGELPALGVVMIAAGLPAALVPVPRLRDRGRRRASSNEVDRADRESVAVQESSKEWQLVH